MHTNAVNIIVTINAVINMNKFLMFIVHLLIRINIKQSSVNHMFITIAIANATMISPFDKNTPTPLWC